VHVLTKMTVTSCFCNICSLWWCDKHYFSHSPQCGSNQSTQNRGQHLH